MFISYFCWRCNFTNLFSTRETVQKVITLEEVADDSVFIRSECCICKMINSTVINKDQIKEVKIEKDD